MTVIRILFATCACIFGVANAQAARSDDEFALDKAIADLKHELALRDEAIRNLIQRVEKLEAAVGSQQSANETQASPAVAAAPSQPVAAKEAAQTQDIEHIRAAFERTLIDRGGLVLPKWNWEVDTGLTYSHSSSEKLTIDGFTVYPVLIVGDIVSERVRRDTVGFSVTGRVGLPWQTQFEMRLPYSYENNSRLTAAGDELAVSDRGIGDLELGISRPLWHSHSGAFDLLGAIRWKSTSGRDPFGLTDDRIPFGTGFNALSAAVTAVATDDPLVFFGTVTYTNDLPSRKGDKQINPGDTFGLQVGTALAVNLDTSLSFGYQQQFTTRTRVDGKVIPGSYINTGSFSVNLSHTFASGRSIDTGLVIGLSEDSPDLQLTFSMPFKGSRR